MRANEGHEQDISIATNGITVHPQYNQGTQYNNDIAVIRLSRSVQFTQRIKPVCFNSGIDFTGKVTLFLEQYRNLSRKGEVLNATIIINIMFIIINSPSKGTLKRRAFHVPLLCIWFGT
jgi:hypothetical protein